MLLECVWVYAAFCVRPSDSSFWMFIEEQIDSHDVAERDHEPDECYKTAT